MLYRWPKERDQEFQGTQGYIEFKASPDYTVRACLKNKKQANEKIHQQQKDARKEPRLSSPVLQVAVYTAWMTQVLSPWEL